MSPSHYLENLDYPLKNGTAAGARTRDPQIKSLLLCQTELRPHLLEMVLAVGLEPTTSRVRAGSSGPIELRQHLKLVGPERVELSSNPYQRFILYR